MTQKPDGYASLLERGASFAGRMAGMWRHRQRARAQDLFVELWKVAWVQGCEAAWAGRASLAPPKMTEAQRAAWAAGWTWAQTQPDRRRRHLSRDSRKLGGRRSTDAPRPLVRAAKGGVVGLVGFAAARWLMRMRRASPPSSSVDASPP